MNAIKQESSNSDWRVGIDVEARDLHNAWYKAKIIKVDNQNKRVLVHFHGWNSRYDQWFDQDSNDIRILNNSTSASHLYISDTDVFPPPGAYPLGEKVLAKWTNGIYYPSTVIRHVKKNDMLYYQVLFDDGFKRLVRCDHTKRTNDENITKTLSVYQKPQVASVDQLNEVIQVKKRPITINETNKSYEKSPKVSKANQKTISEIAQTANSSNLSVIKQPKAQFELNLEPIIQKIPSLAPNTNQQIKNESSALIKCIYETCPKTFRKQHLLNYHIKYHHYPDGRIIENPSKRRKKTLDSVETKELEQNIQSIDQSVDPYEVINCKCNINHSDGFMIQCENCLCWQHGLCEEIDESNPPENYKCWNCTKYSERFKEKNWMIDLKNDELSLLLANCSKKHADLNKLAISIELQMSELRENNFDCEEFEKRLEKCEKDQEILDEEQKKLDEEIAKIEIKYNLKADEVLSSDLRSILSKITKDIEAS